MAEFELHVTDIDEAGKDYAFELSPAWLDTYLQDASVRHDPAHGPGQLKVHAQENGVGEYLVTGTLRVHVLTDCGRCLGDAKLAVDITIATLFGRTSPAKASASSKALVTPKAAAPKATAAAPRPGAERRARERQERQADQKEDEDDDFPREEFSGYSIALDEFVREHIVLEVPMQPLCGEACTGIAIPEHLRPPPDVFPASDALDPRLAPLQRLRDNVPPMSQPEAPLGTPARKQPDRQPKPKPKFNKE